MKKLEFVHQYLPIAPGSRTLLLLHGTGGDESDLIPLGRELDPNAALVSPRGKILENGMPRFFRRFAEGVFDEEDVVRRANELADFVVGGRFGIRLRRFTADRRRLLEWCEYRSGDDPAAAAGLELGDFTAGDDAAVEAACASARW